MRPALRIATALAFLPVAGCVGYVRVRIDEPVPPERLGSLRAGVSSLQACLRELGAPTEVFEHRGDGMALVWSWQDQGDWSLDVSVPVTDSFNASFDLDLTDAARPGLVLWFGPDLVLERWQQGTLGELLPRRTRPADPEAAGS